jgi:aryl-alcohol dehydrogenase-like predicted oxidoreductase
MEQREQQNASEKGRLTVISSRSGDPINVMFKDKDILITEQVSKTANEIGCSPAQISLNWIRQREKGRKKIIPIIGARKESQIKENLECLNFELTKEQLNRLEEISKIELGFPYDFLHSDKIKDIIYGGTFASIQNHES